MKARNIIPKALILLCTLYAMIRMWHWAIGFSFFTQLSNLFAALVVAVQLGRSLANRKSQSAAVVKFTATVSILVTFLVYLLVLAPIRPGGVIGAYREDGYASLCLHLITPLLTLADFLISDADYPWRPVHSLCALIPPVVYFLFILLLGGAGVRWYMGMPVPYMFLNYAAPCGWFGIMPETAGVTTTGIGVFYVMLLLLGLFCLAGLALIALARRVERTKRARKSSEAPLSD